MKKRVVLPTLCFAVLSSAAFAKTIHADALHTPASVISSKKQIQYVAVNKGSFLNMRSSASVKASILLKLSAGTPVSVLSATKDWSKILVNGKTGYVSSQYLNPSNGTPSKTTAKPSSNTVKSSAVKSITKYVNVRTGSTLNMRSSSSTNASVIAWLKNGTAVKVLSDSKGWSRVQVNGKTGYVSSQYLTAAKPAASTSTVKPKTTQASSSAKISSIPTTASVKITTKYVNVQTGVTLNLRSSGSTKASVIAWLKNGTAVKVLSDSKGWSKVQVNGKTGYVSSQYLTAGKSVASGNTAKTTTPVQSNTSGTTTPSKTTTALKTATKYVKVDTGGRLNIRASGSTKASIIGTLANNTSVIVVSEANGWAKVQVSGKTGYVSSQFLTVTKPKTTGSGTGTSAPVNTVTKYVAVAAGSYLNLRSSASMNGGILAGLTQGTKVVVLSEAKGWSKIQAKGITGYVGTQYLSTSVPKQFKAVPIPRYVSAASVSGISMYTKPSENSSVIAKLAKGVQVLVQSESNGWSDIQAYGREGYVKTALLTDVKPTGNKGTDSNNGSAGDSQDVIKYVDVDGKSNLNMRDSASPTGNILSKLARGTAVKILAEANGWSKVTANGKMGYVSSQYLSEDLAAPPGLINGSKTYTYKKYTLSLNDMVNIEMKAAPQTDRKYNTYLRDDALELNNASKPTSGIVQGDKWNVRGGPGTSFWTVSQVSNGTVLNILSAVQGSDGHIWYQVKLNQTWVNASPDDVKYYLDPNNFENDPIKSYQFLDLSASTNLQADEVNSRILSGKGILAGKASSFIQAGETLHINEIYLIAHALLETGNGLSQLANGVQVNGKIVYNMYGIGAYDSDSLHSGAQFAYNAGWFTPEQAIIGGAKFIAQDYINAGQNTLYKMRWNPDAAQTSSRAAHQYATDIGWADKQIVQMQNLYSLVSYYTLAYDVPVYR